MAMNSDGGKLKRFGRYLLLDHLADGGMAKLCRARFLSEDVNRIVAIKMIQPRFLEDKKFKNMLLSEIKLNFGFNHPNIAQTYDYGYYKDQIFTAMEFVDGKNLKEFINCLKERDRVFPIEIAVYVISQTCRGLAYAHSFKDKLSGKKINIIHRDISPHNIMLTFDGNVKIIDFGIAKTDNRQEDTTKVGTIKGKISYLSPEYLLGKELDHRYDQFAAGITLWELLCSQKLFDAKDGASVFKQIEACEISPPSDINPNVPKELDFIVLKSLSRNREDRFSNMEDMGRDLEKFLYSHFPDFSISQVISFARSLFEKEILKDQAKFFEFGKIDIKPYMEDLKKEVGKVSTKEGYTSEEKEIGTGDIKPISEILSHSRRGVDLELTQHEGLNQDNTAINEVSRSRWSRYKDLGSKRRQDHSGHSLGGRGKRRKVLLRLAFSFLVVFCIVSFQGRKLIEHPKIFPYIMKIAPWIYNEHQDPSRELASIEDSGLAGSFKLKGFKKNDQKLYINGELVKYREFFPIKLSLNNHYKMVIIQEGRKPLVYEFSLTEDSPHVTYKVQDLDIALWGEISVLAPLGGVLEIDFEGIKVKKDIPFYSHPLPPGVYTGVVKGKLLRGRQEETVSFEVQEGQRNKLKF